MGVFYLCVMNVPSIPSREQERAAEGVRPLMVAASLRFRAPQLDGAPAFWHSWLRTTFELPAVSRVSRVAANAAAAEARRLAEPLPGSVIISGGYLGNI